MPIAMRLIEAIRRRREAGREKQLAQSQAIHTLGHMARQEAQELEARYQTGQMPEVIYDAILHDEEVASGAGV